MASYIMGSSEAMPKARVSLGQIFLNIFVPAEKYCRHNWKDLGTWFPWTGDIVPLVPVTMQHRWGSTDPLPPSSGHSWSSCADTVIGISVIVFRKTNFSIKVFQSTRHNLLEKNMKISSVTAVDKRSIWYSKKKPLLCFGRSIKLPYWGHNLNFKE